MARTLAFRLIDDNGSVVVVVGAGTPSDADWKLLLEAHRRDRHQRTLVVSGGGAPSPSQRKAILDASGGKGLPAAILTDSVVVRGIVTALSWFSPKIRAYAPDDLSGALDHLGLTIPAPVVQRVIDELKRELGTGHSRD